jgi:hypothetical protein
MCDADCFEMAVKTAHFVLLNDRPNKRINYANDIQRLVFLMSRQVIVFEVGVEFLNIIDLNVSVENKCYQLNELL